MLFILGLPCLQIILFCWAIGHDPKGLKLAIANHELNNTDMGLTVIDQTCPVSAGCDYTLLSCRYLSFLKSRSVVHVSVIIYFKLLLKMSIIRIFFLHITLLIHGYFKQEFYGSEEDANEEVRRGRAWGAMVFQKNYSDSLVERTQMGRTADQWVLEASDLAVRFDMSSKLTDSIYFIKK